MITNIKAGDVFLVDFKGEGHVMRGQHPAVVISCDKANFYSPNVIVIEASPEEPPMPSPGQGPGQMSFVQGSYPVERFSDASVVCRNTR